MKAKQWQDLLTNTDVIPSNKPLFSLRFLFILAACATIIFYRFVYIYLYNIPIAKYLYDYKISYASKTYIEGFFLSTWIIFIIVGLFRLSDFIIEKILSPLFKIISNGTMQILYTLDFITEKTYCLYNNKKYKNKTFTNNEKNSKIKERTIKKTKTINDRRKKQTTSLYRTQRKNS